MKILVADDHELFLKGLEFILRDFLPEAELVFAKNYQELFNEIGRAADFDLILTDLAMPGANWNEAISRIHAALPETPIIILSAVFDKEIVHKTIEQQPRSLRRTFYSEILSYPLKIALLRYNLHTMKFTL